MHQSHHLARHVGFAAVVLLAAACGGDDGGAAVDSGSPEETAEGATPDGQNSGETAVAAGGGSAIVTVDGVAVTFSMDDVVHSQFDGVDDVTFEECNPSFFGAGFRVIGYAVDPDGELILDEDGGIAGTLVLTFPLTEADEATTGPPELELVYPAAGFDHDLVPLERVAEAMPGAASTWTVGTSTIGGSVVLANVLGEAVVADFEVSCS